ncbi:MAG: tetratricopeptide repeat protein [Candidatus Hydrogenedentes bacterium]|nr:tetratricopeptide repeat protein [Candidatus Hydrogenedentota bacterium]
MSSDFAKQTLVKNWYLFIVLIAFVFAALYQFLAPREAVETDAAQMPGSEMARVQRTAPTVAPRDLVADERAKLREEALTKIRENEAALAEHPEPERAAALAAGIGNMYFQRLQDYSAAASHYERVLSDYPEAPLKYQTFVQLVQCYEHLNDPDKRRDTLRRMMEAFPEDSQQYTYAYLELYGQMPAAPKPTDTAVETAESAEQEASDPSTVVAQASVAQ